MGRASSGKWLRRGRREETPAQKLSGLRRKGKVVAGIKAAIADVEKRNRAAVAEAARRSAWLEAHPNHRRPRKGPGSENTASSVPARGTPPLGIGGRDTRPRKPKAAPDSVPFAMANGSNGRPLPPTRGKKSLGRGWTVSVKGEWKRPGGGA